MFCAREEFAFPINPSGEPALITRVRSSSYAIVSHSSGRSSFRTSIYKRLQRIGPSTDPWGTPWDICLLYSFTYFFQNVNKDYVNKEYSNYLASVEIQRQTTIPYSLQLNGVSERTNISIMEEPRSML